MYIKTIGKTMYFFLNNNLFLLLCQLITSEFPFIIWITRQSKQVYFRGWNTKKPPPLTGFLSVAVAVWGEVL